MALADLSAIGFYAFAAVTFASGTVECGWYTDDSRGLFASFLMFGGLAQLFAGVWDGLRGSAAGGVILGAFGFYWCGEAIAMFPNLNGIAQAKYPSITEYNRLVGFYKLAWAFFCIPMTYVMFRASMLQGVTLFLVAIIFLLHALAAIFSDSHSAEVMHHISGYLMIIAAGLAYYLGSGLYLAASGCSGLPFGEPLIPGGLAGASRAPKERQQITDNARSAIEIVEA